MSTNNKTNFELVEEFHKTFSLPTFTELRHPDKAEIELRIKLQVEEHNEVLEAIGFGDVYHIAKELADLIYICYGTALTYGIDLDKVFAEVHRSNMSKLTADGKVLRREDGKVLKSDQYELADVKKVLG